MTVRPLPGDAMSARNPRRRSFEEDRAPCLSCPGRLLSFAPQVGNGLYTQNTGGKTTPPIYGGNPEERTYVGYLLDFFLENSPEEQKLWIAEHQSEIATWKGE